MKGFLEQYGVGIFTLVIIAILIAFTGPFGGMIKTATNNQIKNVDKIGTERVANADRPEEPKVSQNYVYACLYKNGELVFSANEIKSKENVRRDYGKVELASNTLPTWNENATEVLTVRFETAIKPTSCYSWFENMGNLVEIKNLEAVYTDKCDSMENMFRGCNCLIAVDTKHFDTKNFSTMAYMFFGCENVKSLDV